MGKKVFLVDDDMDDREMFGEAVSDVAPSFECITAQNGAEALDLLSGDFRPDFIFLDLNMPKMNGRDCLIEIRKIGHLAQIPVIVYTTSSLSLEKQELIQLGASMFVTKPATFGGLCSLLYKILNNSAKPVSMPV